MSRHHVKCKGTLNGVAAGHYSTLKKKKQAFWRNLIKKKKQLRNIVFYIHYNGEYWRRHFQRTRGISNSKGPNFLFANSSLK